MSRTAGDILTWGVAQSAERRRLVPEAAGSTPAAPTMPNTFDRDPAAYDAQDMDTWSNEQLADYWSDPPDERGRALVAAYEAGCHCDPDGDHDDDCPITTVLDRYCKGKPCR